MLKSPERTQEASPANRERINLMMIVGPREGLRRASRRFDFASRSEQALGPLERPLEASRCP